MSRCTITCEIDDVIFVMRSKSVTCLKRELRILGFGVLTFEVRYDDTWIEYGDDCLLDFSSARVKLNRLGYAEEFLRILLCYMCFSTAMAAVNELLDAMGCTRKLSKRESRVLGLRELFLRDCVFVRRAFGSWKVGGSEIPGIESDAAAASRNRSHLHLTARFVSTDDVLKEHVLFVGAKQAHDAIHFESAFTAALQRLGEYGIGIDRDSFGSAHSDRGGTESSTAIKQTFRVRAYEAKHRVSSIFEYICTRNGWLVRDGQTASTLSHHVVLWALFWAANESLKAWLLRYHDLHISSDLLWEKAAGVRFGGVGAASVIACHPVNGKTLLEWTLKYVELFPRGHGQGSSVSKFLVYFDSQKISEVKRMHDAYNLTFCGSAERASNITRSKERTLRTLVSFWTELASKFAHVYQNPQDVLHNGRVVKNAWLDADVTRVQEDAVGRKVSLSKVVSPLLNPSSFLWQNTETSRSQIPSDLLGGGYREFLPCKGRRPNDYSAPLELPTDSDTSTPVGFVREMAFRALLITLRELDDFCNFKEEDLDVRLPHNFSPEVSEGVCSTIRKVLANVGHMRISDEVLRAQVVFRRRDSVPTEPERAEVETLFGSIFTQQAKKYLNATSMTNERSTAGFERLDELLEKNNLEDVTRNEAENVYCPSPQQEMGRPHKKRKCVVEDADSDES